MDWYGGYMSSTDWAALGAGTTSGASSFLSNLTAQQSANTTALSQSLSAGLASSQASAAASTATANAALTASQAKIAAVQSEAKVAENDRQRSMLTRLYKQTQASATATFAAGNVDISTGSALASLTGNATRYASDLATNSYNKAVLQYESGVTQNSYNLQAGMAAAGMPGQPGRIVGGVRISRQADALKAALEFYQGADVGTTVHENAHLFFDKMPAAAKEPLKEWYRQEMAGKANPPIFDEFVAEKFTDWFLKNKLWLHPASRADGFGGYFGQAANRLRTFLDKVMGVDGAMELTPEEYSRLLDIAGHETQLGNLKDKLNTLVSKPAYQRLATKSDGPDGAAAAEIKGVLRDAREMALERLYRETPRIQNAVYENTPR